jgi:hypothetical protein
MNTAGIPRGGDASVRRGQYYSLRRISAPEPDSQRSKRRGEKRSLHILQKLTREDCYYRTKSNAQMKLFIIVEEIVRTRLSIHD